MPLFLSFSSHMFSRGESKIFWDRWHNEITKGMGSLRNGDVTSIFVLSVAVCSDFGWYEQPSPALTTLKSIPWGWSSVVLNCLLPVPLSLSNGGGVICKPEVIYTSNETRGDKWYVKSKFPFSLGTKFALCKLLPKCLRIQINSWHAKRLPC